MQLQATPPEIQDIDKKIIKFDAAVWTWYSFVDESYILFH